jgi:hypothetical protein
VVAVNPTNGNEVYLGTAYGGLLHTSHVTDPDPHWDPLFDGPIGSILLDDCSPTVSNACGTGTCGCNNIFVGTGEDAVRRDTYYGSGVFLMTTRTTTEPPFAFQPFADGNTTLGLGAVGKLIFGPPMQTLYALVTAGVTASSSESTVTAPANYGIYQSTSGGAWTPVNIAGVPAGALPSDLQATADGNTLFAAFMGQGIFRNDGTGWCSMNGPNATCSNVTGLPSNAAQSNGLAAFSWVTLSIAKSDPKVLYASFGGCEQPGPANAVVASGGARRDFGCPMTTQYFRSTDQGATWANLAITASSDIDPTTGFHQMNQYPNYTHVLTIDPTNANVFWAGGLNMWRCVGSAANTNYTCTAQGADSLHPDFHDIEFPSNSNAPLFAATDGGFAIGQFTNGAFAFTHKNGFVPTTQFQSVGTNPNLTMVVGGMQDNAYGIFSGGRAWTSLGGGDGGNIVLDVNGTQDIEYVAEGTPANWGFWAGGPYVFFFPNPSQLPPDVSPIVNEARAFFPPLKQHPSTRDLYVATSRLYKSNDTGPGPRGTSWTSVSPGSLAPDGNVSSDTEATNYISAIGLSPSNANNVYIGFYNGEIFASISAGPCSFASCWNQIGGPGATTNITLPAAPVTSIAVDPSTPTTIYVTYSGFNIGGKHVFKYVGGSATWSDFSSGLPDIPAHVIAIEPSNSQNLWLGTDQGVFSTIMGSSSAMWSKTLGAGGGFLITSNLPNIPVYDLSIDETNRRIIAATHGRGMWVLSSPLVYTEEGWVKKPGDTVGTIWDIPTFGNGFPPDPAGRNIPCTLQLIQRSGNVCAQGPKTFFPPTFSSTARGRSRRRWARRTKESRSSGPATTTAVSAPTR